MLGLSCVRTLCRLYRFRVEEDFLLLCRPWQETSSATSNFKKIMDCLKSIQSPSSWCQTQLQLIKRNTGVVVMTGSAPTAAPTPSLAGS